MKLTPHEEASVAPAVGRLGASEYFTESRSAFLIDPLYAVKIAEAFHISRARATKTATMSESTAKLKS